MGKIYGYCRISNPKQHIERQVRNIQREYPDADIRQEVFTGVVINRKELNWLLDKVVEGDTIVFDSVSRMSRDAAEGWKVYQHLYNKGVNLVFLKEPMINTDTYKNAMRQQIPMTGSNVDLILKGINEYLMTLAEDQVKLAFLQAEKEVMDLRQRTREGIETARLKGKQIGTKAGSKRSYYMEAPAKEKILKYNKSFGGQLNDTETIKVAGISNKTFYKYKKQLIQEEGEKQNLCIDISEDEFNRK